MQSEGSRHTDLIEEEERIIYNYLPYYLEQLELLG